MSFTLPWTVNKFVSTNINATNSVSGTYTNVSLKVNGKTELSDATTIASLGVGKNTSASYAVDVLGKINASGDISTSGNVLVSGITATSDITTTGNVSASLITTPALKALSIIPTNRPALSTNRYIVANNETINWEDPQNIIFNGSGNWTTYLPSVVSGGISRVGSRFTFGFTINWTGTKQIQAQSTQYIYDGGSLLNTINVSVTSSTQHYIELLCVNYTPGNICWTVINRAYQYSLPAMVTFNSGITVSSGITATTSQTINFGTNAPTMAGTNISGVVKPVGTETVQITPTQTPITILNYNFATPAQSVNNYTTIASPYTAITDWTFALVSGTAPSVTICNSFTAYVNNFANQYPEYPLFSQYLSIQNGGISSVFRLTQNLTFATTGSYLLTMYVWGEYNRYSPTQNVSVSCGDGSVSNFTAVEQGWSKIVMRFKIATAGINVLTINLNSSTVDSGLSISGIQIVKQAGLIVTDGTNGNTQIITTTGTYTNGSLYNTGSISNYGSFKVFGPLSLFLPYSSGSIVIGSSLYGAQNSSDKGKYSVLIGQSIAGASTSTQALYIDSCVAIGYAALEQAGTSAGGIFRCIAIGYKANRWNTINCNDNVSIGDQAGSALGYSGVSSQRNTSVGSGVLGGSYVSSNDNTVIGYQSMANTNFSFGRSFNSVVGSSSLYSVSSNYNSSLGYSNAPNMLNSASNYNTFIGSQVCSTQSGSTNVLLNCTFLGSASDVSTAGSYSNSTCLGYNSRITGSNQIILGTANETTYAMGGLTIPNSKLLTITGNIVVNSQTVTPTQVANLNRIYIETDISNNIAFATPPPGGYSNYVFGFQSMNGALTTGYQNLAFGINSMINLTSGTNNTGISQFSLSQITTGINNTSCGFNSGKCPTTSSFNSFFGCDCGIESNIINYCSAFGANSGITVPASYSTAIGYGVKCTASNQIKIGRSTETTIFDGPVVFNNTSTMSGASITANTIAGSSIVSSSIGQTQVLNGYVNLSSAQTVGGIKTFSLPPVMYGNSIISNTIPGASIVASSIGQAKVQNGYVDLVNDQTIVGFKTFSDPPFLNGANITLGSIQGASIYTGSITQVQVEFGFCDLINDQSISGGKTFLSAPSMSGGGIYAGSIPDSALTTNVALLSGTQTFSGTKTFTGGITATGTQAITFGTNAPTMSGANISATSIPDSALTTNIPLKNGTNTFTGANAINNQYINSAYGSVITSTATLTTLSSIIYSYYSVSAAATAYTITLPTLTAANLGQNIIFRRVGGTVTTAISFTSNGTQLVYNTALTGSATNALMASGQYIVRLVGLLVTGTTYAYFQV